VVRYFCILDFFLYSPFLLFIRLKDNSLNVVKIADFGLSDFYRPGAMIKSSCGTLSFLAPEVFRGTANAGPPLDVWAMGVILFAMLCGRLPFEGPDLVGTKRPREAVIKSKILKCQYKMDDSLGPEAKDLVRRMLQLDPAERMTIPEIFNHVWVRVATSNHWADSQLYNIQPSNEKAETSVNSQSLALNTASNTNSPVIEFLSPFSAAKVSLFFFLTFYFSKIRFHY
jgi:serine/threonine protein kinase